MDGWDGDGRRVSPPKQRVHFVSFDGQVRNSGDMAILAGEIFKHQQRSPKFVLRGNSAALLSSAAEPKPANLISTSCSKTPTWKPDFSWSVKTLLPNFIYWWQMSAHSLINIVLFKEWWWFWWNIKKHVVVFWHSHFLFVNLLHRSLIPHWQCLAMLLFSIKLCHESKHGVICKRFRKVPCQTHYYTQKSTIEIIFRHFSLFFLKGIHFSAVPLFYDLIHHFDTIHFSPIHSLRYAHRTTFFKGCYGQDDRLNAPQIQR